MELNDSNSSCCENSTEVISRVVQEMQNKHGYKVNGLPFGGKDECEVDHGEVKQHKPETEISTKYQCHHMESLSDCSGISRPLENSEGMVLENSGAEGNTQKNGQAYHAKIFLKDLIQLTLLDSGEWKFVKWISTFWYDEWGLNQSQFKMITFFHLFYLVL